MGEFRKGKIAGAIFFLSLSMFFIYMIFSGKYMDYINKKFLGMLIFASIILFLIGIFNLLELRKFKSRESGLTPLLLLFFLGLLYIGPKVDISVKAIPANQVIKQANRNIVFDKKEDRTEDLSEDDKATLEAIKKAQEMDEERQRNNIDYKNIVEDEKYADAIEYVATHRELEGEKIKIKGKIFNDNNKLFVGRFLMFCCAADAVPLGLFVEETPDLIGYDGWVEIEGKVHFDEEKEEIRLIDINYNKVEAGDIYVYPGLYFDVNNVY